ncbi:MAG: hypothetical protein RBG1_1C00001G0276 [candidate division Zixibacteria bacterium RBG-1]|nr:MAG: hypothetical protein RBG1_1C00001G0276 [candidate division Zixibacteria bacterium RBG-1]
MKHKPVLIKNQHDIELLKVIKYIGVVNMEFRDDLHHPLPPYHIYELADQEIAISAVSAYRTFDQHIEFLRDALKNGIRIYVLILHPNSPEVDSLSKREDKPILDDIKGVIGVIKRENFYNNSNFKIKFLIKLPPYTAVMIDGDIETIGKPMDRYGLMRIQLRGVHSTQHEGLIIQLKKKNNKQRGAFEYYAKDLRDQWKIDGTEHPELFSS